MHKFPHWILKFTFKIEFSNPALGGSNINMNWPIPSKGRGGSTQQFAPKQNPKFLLRILQIFLKELFARKAASSGMVGIVTKRGKSI